MGAEHLYLQHRAVIDQAIATVCRRHCLSPTDADDFKGVVNLRLIENDFAILRKFEQRSSFRTYMASVITHQYQDWRNARWGKWRPSAEAKRQGAVAIHLERLIGRDGLSFEQAQETLRTNYQIPHSRQQLEALAARLPARQGREFVREEELVARPASGGAPDEPMRTCEAASAARHACTALSRALANLSAEDRLLLRMRFDDGMTVVQIAGALHLESKPLYRRIDRLLAQLRTAMERAGVSATAVANVLSTQAVDWVVDDDASPMPSSIGSSS